MAVRPFYLEADAEGRHTEIKGGPRRADGYMNTSIYQRDEGSITEPFRIRQYSTHDLNKETQEEEHHLHTDVYYQGKLLKSHITNY